MTRLPICLEEMQKPRHLKQMARAIVQPPQLQYGFALMGDPECFDQRRNPGAVDIGQLRHIDRERRQRRLPECRKQLVSEFWRRVRQTRGHSSKRVLLPYSRSRSRSNRVSRCNRWSSRHCASSLHSSPSVFRLRQCKASANRMPFKTLRPAPHGDTIFSRIREPRDCRGWIGEESPSHCCGEGGPPIGGDR